MAQEKTTTMADGNVSKVTALPEGCTLALFDSSGGVTKIDAQKFMELVRGSIQIGGRNLLKGTKDFTGWAKKSGGIISSDTHDGLRVAKCEAIWSGLYLKFTYEAGCSYVLSLYADKNSGVHLFPNYPGSKDVLHIETDAEITASTTKFTPCSDGWYRWSVSFQCTKSGLAVIEIESTEEQRVLCFCGVKLERGNIATDWTPAPEDFGGGGKITCHTDSYILQLTVPLEVAHHSEERRAA